MRLVIILCMVIINGLCGTLQLVSSQTRAQTKRVAPAQKRTVIAASTLLDGKGHVMRNTRIVIEGSKIVAIDPKATRWITTFVA
jgi:hypothetical protein